MDSAGLELFFIAVMILLNGFFSGAELAIISARKARIAQMAAAGDERAVTVEKLQDDPHRFLATVQIGVTVVGSMASAVGGATAVQFLKPVLEAAPVDFVRDAAGPIALATVVVLLSYLTLVFGELVPKALALQYAERFSLVAATPIRILSRVGGVAVSLLSWSSRSVLALFGVKAGEGQVFLTREDVQHIIAEGRETGVFSDAEQEYIKNIFDFTHTAVREVMVPRTRIVALNLDLPLGIMVEAALENMYSRYPVYRESIENIVGFIHGKDLLGKIVTEREFDINAIVRPPYFVPEGKKVNDLLKEMQKNRVHMALVVDEYGGLSGLVTTEDLLEELVGEIEDEHDVGEPHRVTQLPDGSLMVDALLSIYDLEGPLNADFAEDLPFDTVAGLILHGLGRFPRKGEKVSWNGFAFICEEVKPTGILKVRVLKEVD
ncbi:MAG TPA: hemolysin family protein [Verrucomicrobiae bacterium]|nr:hemolysin family protein [Verrucomicrobiae bacterium]